MSELRRDPVVGRWVIISTERGERPTDYPTTPPEPAVGFCPFCPGNEHVTPPEIFALREPGSEPNAPGWRLRVVSNKFPALQIEGEVRKRAKGLYDVMNGVGAHEVFIETPSHEQTISTHTPEGMVDLVETYQNRMADLENDRRLKSILIFRNAGQAGGASLRHPHSQLIATPTVPKRIFEELKGVETYFNFKERCVFCDMVDEELESGDRIVEENAAFISFAPFASRFPFETWILPKRHNPSYSSIRIDEIAFFAEALHRTIRKIDASLNYPAYNYILHTAPCNLEKEYLYHWHVEIIPRLTSVAGFEWGTGFYINPMPPEKAAADLRNTEI